MLSAGCLAPPPPEGPGGQANAVPALTNRGGPADSRVEPALDVRLDALSGGSAPPGDPVRNPFRLAPPAPGGVGRSGSTAPPPGEADGRRPAEEESAVRFLGVLEARESAGFVGVVADGEGRYHGRVNDVVGGRYRIVALDRAALVIERLDDGERRTLRRRMR